MKLLEEVQLQIVTSLKGKDLLSLVNYSSEEVQQLIDLAIQLKTITKEGKCPKLLEGKTLAMIFEKNSTRTRISFEVGMHQLGGKGMYMNARDLQIGRGESVYDTAHVLSGYVDGIMIRANSHAMVKELAEHASIPVINGLTDISHPCQALADLETIKEVKGHFKGLKLAYIGDGNNVAHSLVVAAAHVGMDVVVAAPKGYEPSEQVMLKAATIAAQNGSTVSFTNDPIEAATDADVIYTDVWTSMGQEEESAKRLRDFEGFQISSELVAYAKPDYMFLHCLPAHREEEVATAVIDGENSYIFQQAENRLHAQKAVLVSVLG
ncbi:ornithine carbamoyltransferase [Kurthia gibsonii]|uniref:ornithine carbamoyltransferase n=1 Tax=Kurthia TaxID=1649 RepID=UPI000745D9C7|nr:MULTISPECIES: ornithine carbamoyltransferase [Kurthia]AMA62179.1 ornithine carbamoyltransferase [Kurthia sp. 11kri321]MEB6112623.1 ornithine carbamoyltransferase [Kurthia gibsonii]WIL37751.1 ornithine carbamoyltransferase [Kurthia sp. YJT4]HZG12988.1 ornithine carbamoyltransferase [Kurthia gibsonii]